MNKWCSPPDSIKSKLLMSRSTEKNKLYECDTQFLDIQKYIETLTEKLFKEYIIQRIHEASKKITLPINLDILSTLITSSHKLNNTAS